MQRGPDSPVHVGPGVLDVPQELVPVGVVDGAQVDRNAILILVQHHRVAAGPAGLHFRHVAGSGLGGVGRLAVLAVGHPVDLDIGMQLSVLIRNLLVLARVLGGVGDNGQHHLRGRGRRGSGRHRGGSWRGCGRHSCSSRRSGRCRRRGCSAGGQCEATSAHGAQAQEIATGELTRLHDISSFESGLPAGSQGDGETKRGIRRNRFHCLDQLTSFSQRLGNACVTYMTNSLHILAATSPPSIHFVISRRKYGMPSATHRFSSAMVSAKVGCSGAQTSRITL